MGIDANNRVDATSPRIIETTKPSIKKTAYADVPQTVVAPKNKAINFEPNFSADAQNVIQIHEIKAFFEGIKNKTIPPTRENVEKLQRYVNNFLDLKNGISAKQYKDVSGSFLYDDISQMLGNKTVRDMYRNLCGQRNRVGEHLHAFRPSDTPESQEKFAQMGTLVKDFDENLTELLKDKIAKNDNNAVVNLLYASEEFPHDLLNVYPDMLTDLSKSGLKYKKQFIINILNKLAKLPLEEQTKSAVANSDLDCLLFDIPYGQQVMGMKTAKTQEQKIGNAVELLRNVAKESRIPSKPGYNVIDPTVAVPNGKIDEPLKMGVALGDCGFVAGMMSLANNQKGKKLLDSMITLNKDSKSVSVKLHNDSTEYTVPRKGIISRPDYVTGDGDARAIEFALDKKIAQQCKDGKYQRVDIRAIPLRKVFEEIVGNGHDIYPKRQMNSAEKDAFYNPVIADFNNKDKAYAFGIIAQYLDGPNALSELNRTKIVSEDGSQILQLYDEHAYAILREDGQNIYINDPAQGAKVYKISHETFKKFNPIITYTDLPKDEK